MPEQEEQCVEPFGFKLGMTRAQVIALVGAGSVREDRGDLLILSTAPEPNPDFDTYGVSISLSAGIARVVAISKSIETNGYGEELKEQFRATRKVLENQYDSAETFELVRPGSTWRAPKDWMMSLAMDERVLTSIWIVPGKAIITLDAFASSEHRGFVGIQYQFPNFGRWLSEHVREREDEPTAF